MFCSVAIALYETPVWVQNVGPNFWFSMVMVLALVISNGSVKTKFLEGTTSSRVPLLVAPPAEFCIFHVWASESLHADLFRVFILLPFIPEKTRQRSVTFTEEATEHPNFLKFTPSVSRTTYSFWSGTSRARRSRNGERGRLVPQSGNRSRIRALSKRTRGFYKGLQDSGYLKLQQHSREKGLINLWNCLAQQLRTRKRKMRMFFVLIGKTKRQNFSGIL